MNQLRLVVRNLGPFTHYVVKATKCMIYLPSATGKTTIAKTLYGFLTGNVSPDLLSMGKDFGEATLYLDGKTFRLRIERGRVSVDRVLDAEYAEYLAFTEGTLLYSFYVSPPKKLQIDIDALVPAPSELVKLENELRRVESQLNVHIRESIEVLVKNLEIKERERERLCTELAKLEERIRHAVPSEQIQLVLTKRELEEKLKRLEQRKSELENEYTRLLLSLQSTDYEELKRRRKAVYDEIERLRTRYRLVAQARNAIEKLKEGLHELEDVIDVLFELNIPLFGTFVDSNTISMWMNDIASALSTLASKMAELDSEIARRESELRDVANEIDRYVQIRDRLSALNSERARIESEIRKVSRDLETVKKRVEELLSRVGMDEDTFLRKALYEENLERLLQRKREISRRLEDLEREIASLKQSLEHAKRKSEELAEIERGYKELKERVLQMKREYQEKVSAVKERFFAYFNELLPAQIKDFDRRKLEFHRAPQTFSQSERFAVVLAYQYAYVSTLVDLGYEIPFVVIDVPVPMDEKWFENTIRKAFEGLARRARFPVLMLVTGSSDRVCVE